MVKTTISFTIEEEQLQRVDELTEKLDRDRSSTLRLLIETAMLSIDQPQTVHVLTDRDKMRGYATKVSQALKAGPVPVIAGVSADADMADAGGQ